MSNNIILVDTQNVLMILGYRHKEEILDGSRTELLSDLMKVITDIQDKMQIKNVLFALEGYPKKNWRREIWPLYKQNRSDRKKKSSDIDKKYNKTLNNIGAQFISEYIVDKSNWNSLRFDNMEADDIINVVAITQAKLGNTVRIISRDVDFMMLMDLPNIGIYDPVKNNMKKFPYQYTSSKVIVNDPQVLTEMCVCNGQTKDHIWNAKSTEENKCRFGEKTCFNMLCDPTARKQFYDKYKSGIYRNNRILNPFKTPKDIVGQVMIEFNKLEWHHNVSVGGSLFDRLKRGEI